MKKPILISLLLLHLMGNTELCQLISVPKLFEHFHTHRLWNPDASFISFVSSHYLGTDGIDGDDNQDRELPFMHFYHQTSVVSTAPPTVCSTEPGRTPAALRTFKIIDHAHLLPAYVGSLLRPPRMVA
jgi:hypothetical protein